jgi:hypothetical protein
MGRFKERGIRRVCSSEYLSFSDEATSLRKVEGVVERKNYTVILPVLVHNTYLGYNHRAFLWLLTVS